MSAFYSMAQQKLIESRTQLSKFLDETKVSKTVIEFFLKLTTKTCMQRFKQTSVQSLETYQVYQGAFYKSPLRP
jgi:hypothetical protein